MPTEQEIRAHYNKSSIVVYQAYSDKIAKPALAAGRFVPPFSLGRMTWIKPSFLWLMERSNWAKSKGQENILAIRISRSGWEEALSKGVLTHFDPQVFSNFNDWQTQFDNAEVHIQWDPERSIHGKKFEYRSIQVGLSRQIIKKYVEDWTLEIKDVTPLAKKISREISRGNTKKARLYLPSERVYPLPEQISHRLRIH